ncbi:hypothetical protein [Mucilaginibacter sp.]
MYHPFSVAETIKTAWNVLKKNVIPLAVYAAISLCISEVVDLFKPLIFSDNGPLSLFITVIIVMIIQSYLALSFYKLILRLMDKEYYEFEFRDIIPSFKMTFNFVVIAFAYSVLIAILLFINVTIEHVIDQYAIILNMFYVLESIFILYLLLRSIFCICFIVDNDSTPFESLRQSFSATQDNFWKIFAMFFIILAYMIVAIIPIFLVVIISGVDDENSFLVQKLMFYSWFILTFPAVQVLIMVTYRKLVYSHLDVDDDISETI